MIKIYPYLFINSLCLYLCSVSVLRLFASEYKDGIRVLEGLAASGLRSIRYAREVEGVTEVVANDISKQAIECMKRNIIHNNVQGIVTPSQKDAR